MYIHPSPKLFIDVEDTPKFCNETMLVKLRDDLLG